MKVINTKSFMIVNGQGGCFLNVDSFEDHADYSKKLVFFNPETAHKNNNYIKHSKIDVEWHGNN